MQFSARQQFFNWVLGRIEEIINFLRLEARILPFCWAKEDPDAQPNINEGDIEMLVTKKMLLALTLIGALVGAGIGALVTRTATTTSAADTSYNTPANSDRTQTQPVNYNTKTPEQVAADNSTQFSTPAEQTERSQL